MAREVNTVLAKIIAEQRGIPEAKAEEIVKSMRSANQYQVRSRLFIISPLTIFSRNMPKSYITPASRVPKKKHVRHHFIVEQILICLLPHRKTSGHRLMATNSPSANLLHLHHSPLHDFLCYQVYQVTAGAIHQIIGESLMRDRSIDMGGIHLFWPGSLARDTERVRDLGLGARKRKKGR
jgi:hypothetical protein